jgi:hypothetical protein
MKKTEDEFVEYMWQLYPDDDQLELRGAMLKAFNFLSGKYDHEEIERKKISELIKNKMIEQGFGVQ